MRPPRKNNFNLCSCNLEVRIKKSKDHQWKNMWLNVLISNQSLPIEYWYVRLYLPSDFPKDETEYKDEDECWLFRLSFFDGKLVSSIVGKEYFPRPIKDALLMLVSLPCCRLVDSIFRTARSLCVQYKN